MTTRKPRAIFIGEENIFNALKGLVDSNTWDWHPHIETPSLFIEGVEKGTVSEDIEAIFITDLFISVPEEEEAFKATLEDYAPYCFIGVLNFYPELKPLIDDFIDTVESEESFEALDSNCKIIDGTNPEIAELISDAIDSFIENEYEDSLETIKIILREGNEEGSDLDTDREALRYIDRENKAAEEEEEQLLDDVSEDNKRVANNEVEIYRKYSPEDFEGLERGKLITISSSKGGVGKSTISLSTAAKIQRISEELVEQGALEKPWKVIILDMDILDSQIGYFTKTKGATIGQIFSKGINKYAIESTTHYNEGLKVDLILGSRRPENGRYYPDDFYRKLIDSLRAMYDFVILDTSVDYTSHLIGNLCYQASDRILLITEPVVPSSISLSKCVEYVLRDEDRTGLGIDPSKIGVVVNRYQTPQDLGDNRSNNIGLEAIESILKGIPIISIVPFKPLVVTTATNNGKIETLLDTPGIQLAIEYCAEFAIYGHEEAAEGEDLEG